MAKKLPLGSPLPPNYIQAPPEFAITAVLPFKDISKVSGTQYLGIRYVVVDWGIKIIESQDLFNDFLKRIWETIPDMVKEAQVAALEIIPLRSGKLMDEFLTNSHFQIDYLEHKLRINVIPYCHPEYPQIISNPVHINGIGYGKLYFPKNPIPVRLIRTTPKGGLYQLYDPLARGDYLQAWTNTIISIILSYLYKAYRNAKYVLIYDMWRFESPSQSIQIARISQQRTTVWKFGSVKISLGPNPLSLSVEYKGDSLQLQWQMP